MKTKNEQCKKFCPGPASMPTQEKTYTMEEIKVLTQLSFPMFGRMGASSNKNSNKKCKIGNNNEQEVKLNNMLTKMHNYYHGNNNDTSDSEDDK
jgi:hypothetical protein